MKQYPRLLVIANECISTVSSNGRTLRNFLVGWPKEKIAQFCIRNTAPDDTICGNYYYVADRDAMRAFLRGKNAAGKMPNGNNGAGQTGSRGMRRTPLTMLARNIVWNSMRWAGKPFYNWVEDFSPEVILLQAGDCAFMLDLARKLSVKYKIPLIIYNSEGYYFKKFDYFRSNGIHRLLYPAFHGQFCRAFRKCIRMAKKSIYCCEKLKMDYDMEFGLPSEVIHTVTQLQPGDPKAEGDDLQIVYLGNLGVGRHEGLVEIGQTLQSISPHLRLQVYGKIPNSVVKKAFDDCSGIDYRGFVSYEQVVRIIHSSDMLIHTESFSDFYREDLKYAFSTKIADCLASGKCFALYAPSGMACTEYLREHDAAFVMETPQELRTVLTELCSNKDLRKAKIQNAQALVLEKHNPQINTRHFQNILCDCVNDGC